MEYKDYYQIMGVGRDATQEDIRKAYRKLARKFHPDVSQDADAEKKFKELGEAYEVLKDPEKRAAYDQLGAHWQHGQSFDPPPGWGRHHFHFGQDDFADFGSSFSDFFSTLFGAEAADSRHGFDPFGNMPGNDIHAKIEIPLEAAYHGGQQTVSFATTGIQGLPANRRTLNVRIPKGITEGKMIRLSGQGHPGRGAQAPHGDLYLEVRFAPHRHFKVDQKDIFLELPITPWEAALGATVSVPTLGGTVELRIPPGTQTGRKLRLKNRGLPGDPAGDQYVDIRIFTPPPESEEAKSLYRQMAQTMPFNPRSFDVTKPQTATD